MTFTKPKISSHKRMVAMAFLEWHLGAELVKHRLELTHIQPALLCPFVILLELRRRNEL